MLDPSSPFSGGALLGDRIRMQTLVLGSGEDLLFPLDECRKFARSLPNAEFAAIEDAGHSIHMENPQAFVKHVIDFLPQR